MTETERQELIVTLERMAGHANIIARLYEEAAQTVAGFDCEADYQEHARDAFEAAQECIDMNLTCRYDGEIEDAREMAR